MHEHTIAINLFHIGVRNDITISPRQEYLGRSCPFATDREKHSGTESCSQSFSPENAIITIEVKFGDRNSLLARDPLKLLGQVHYGSEKRQVIGRWDFACA